jgi:hypothetical protein
MHKNDTHIGFVISKAIRKKMERVAKQHSVSLSSVVRWAIVYYLNHVEAPPAARKGSK